MFDPRPVALAVFLIAAGSLLGQPANDDCADAVNLCAQQPATGSNAGAMGTPTGFCTGTGFGVWYSFTTNSVGGPVTVNIDAIQCPSVSTMNNVLSAVVLSGDGSCTLPSFSAVAPCASDSVAFSVVSTPLQPATPYWVLVSGASNGPLTAAQCAFNITISGSGADIVDVDFDAGPDATIPGGGSTQLHAVGGTTYDWSPTSGLSGNTIADPVAQPNGTTIYTVTTELNGCTYQDQVTVYVERLLSPVNTFTPNGDGINDTWDIAGIRDYPQADVSIYDRWGQRVFHSIGYREPFDGIGLPTATYYWYIQLNDVKGRSDPYTGYVTIIR